MRARLPRVHGVIERRILVNFRAEPAALGKLLPAPFRPKLVGGMAMGGICLIRLAQIRPRFVPGWLGLRSENAAHRIAVEWDTPSGLRQGVYIPRRDTTSRLNHLLGGRLFPGEHHLATFRVAESSSAFSVAFASHDGSAHASVSAHLADAFPACSIFSSLAAASDFFEAGSLGYSATLGAGHFDGLELRSATWTVEALEVEAVDSSFFFDPLALPEGSVEFDSALLMRNIQHEWITREDLCCPASLG